MTITKNSTELDFIGFHLVNNNALLRFLRVQRYKKFFSKKLNVKKVLNLFLRTLLNGFKILIINALDIVFKIKLFFTHYLI